MPFPSLPTARLCPQRGKGRGCAAVLVAAGDKCLSQPRAQDGCGCSPCPRAGGQKFLAHHPEATRGVRECSPAAREIYPGVPGSSGGSGCRGRSHLCPSPPAPPQPLTLPSADPLCLSVHPGWCLPALSQSSFPAATMDLPGAGSGLGAPSLQVFLGCWDCAAREPWTPPGVNVQPRRPLPGHRCVTGWVWMPAACPGSWRSRTCPPCMVLSAPSSQVLGGCGYHLCPTPAVAWTRAESPEARGCPCFGITRAGRAELLFATQLLQ